MTFHVYFSTNLSSSRFIRREEPGFIYRSPFVLVEATPIPYQPGPGLMREPFSLLFRHEAAVVFPQRIYRMDHKGMGEFGIFLVPIARDRDGFIYQAIFN